MEKTEDKYTNLTYQNNNDLESNKISNDPLNQYELTESIYEGSDSGINFSGINSTFLN